MNIKNIKFNDILTQDVNLFLKNKNNLKVISRKPYALDNLLTYRDKFFIKRPRRQRKRKYFYEFFLSNYMVSESRMKHKARKKKKSLTNNIYNLNPYLKINRQKYALYGRKKKREKKPLQYFPQGLKVILTNKEEIAKVESGLYEDLIKDYKKEIDEFMKYEYRTVSRLLEHHNKIKSKKNARKKTNSFYRFYFFKSKYKQFLTLPFINFKLNDQINKLSNTDHPLYLAISENLYRHKLTYLNLYKKIIKSRLDKKNYKTIKKHNKIKNRLLNHQRKRIIFIQLLIKSLIEWFQKKKVKLLNNHDKIQDHYLKILNLINHPRLVNYLFIRFGEIFFSKKHSTRFKKRKRYIRMFHHRKKFIYSFKTTRLSKRRFARSVALSLLSLNKDKTWDSNIWIPKLKKTYK